MKTLRPILALALLAASPLRAQVVNDGATATLTNVTNAITGSVTVGTNGSFTLLVLSDNVLLTNSGLSTVGQNASARSNEVRLVSPTARWRMGSDLVVGDNGAFNRLAISNGALVSANGGIIGNSGGSNSVVVNGTGSLWTNSSSVFVIGSGGNQLLVSGGGRVASFEGYVSGPNNQAVVTGAGSQWNTLRNFYVGLGDVGGRLLVEDGGLLNVDFGGVGVNSLDWSNEVVIAGANSLWSNRLDLAVGGNAAFNRLVISNGGWVVNSSGTVGASASATNNEVVVTGGNSVWSNRLNLTVGQLASGNQLVVGNGGTAVTVGNGAVGLGSGANSNAAFLTDAGSRWLMGGDLFVGRTGAVNRLIVGNGALVGNVNGTLGDRAEASNNLALITGGGSVWTNRNNLDIGGSGPGNQMIVSNGGWVGSAFVRVGVNAGSTGNLVRVTGPGSVWSNSASLGLGNFAPRNRLVIDDGGLVYSGSGVVGGFGSASNNEALVTGPGSLWTNNGSLTIGNLIGFNRLVVSNGAAVRSVSSAMGGSGAISNRAVVTGPGSVWSNRTTLVLGASSVGNRADVSAGGWLAAGDAWIGSASTGNSNTVVLTDSGSGWNTLGTLYVGDVGSRNLLLASNGATVLSSNAFIGASASLGNSNRAIVTGAGTLWNNQNDLVVGNFGLANRLDVSAGATVLPGNLFVGFNSPSANNRVSVDGGTLRAFNAGGTAVLDVRRGTNVFNAGLIDVDRLVLTNALGFFDFNGGTLITRGGRPFVGEYMLRPGSLPPHCGQSTAWAGAPARRVMQSPSRTGQDKENKGRFDFMIRGAMRVGR